MFIQQWLAATVLAAVFAAGASFGAMPWPDMSGFAPQILLDQLQGAPEDTLLPAAADSPSYQIQVGPHKLELPAAVGRHGKVVFVPEELLRRLVASYKQHRQVVASADHADDIVCIPANHD